MLKTLIQSGSEPLNLMTTISNSGSQKVEKFINKKNDNFSVKSKVMNIPVFSVEKIKKDQRPSFM